MVQLYAKITYIFHIFGTGMLYKFKSIWPYLKLMLIARCCIYFTTYDWIQSFVEITIEGRAIYGNLVNKINTLYWPVGHSIHKNNDADDR
jgi:hypothetical protein